MMLEILLQNYQDGTVTHQGKEDLEWGSSVSVKEHQPQQGWDHGNHDDSEHLSLTDLNCQSFLYLLTNMPTHCSIKSKDFKDGVTEGLFIRHEVI